MVFSDSGGTADEQAKFEGHNSVVEVDATDTMDAMDATVVEMEAPEQPAPTTDQPLSLASDVAVESTSLMEHCTTQVDSASPESVAGAYILVEPIQVDPPPESTAALDECLPSASSSITESSLDPMFDSPPLVSDVTESGHEEPETHTHPEPVLAAEVEHQEEQEVEKTAESDDISTTVPVLMEAPTSQEEEVATLVDVDIPPADLQDEPTSSVELTENEPPVVDTANVNEENVECQPPVSNTEGQVFKVHTHSRLILNLRVELTTNSATTE